MPTEADVAVVDGATEERLVLGARVGRESPGDVARWTRVLGVTPGQLVEQRDGHWTHERPAQQRVVQ